MALFGSLHMQTAQNLLNHAEIPIIMCKIYS